MKIEILGTGCAKCRALEENARKAAEAVGVNYEVEKVTSISEISKRGVLMTPALVVNGEVKSPGKVLSAEEIQSFLEGYVSTEEDSRVS